MWGADLYICAGLLIFKFGDYVNDERCTGPIAMSIFPDGLYSIDSSSVYLRCCVPPEALLYDWVDIQIYDSKGSLGCLHLYN
jgi:hypothetical protein